MSAAELAGYVLSTGDQASVVQLLEMMLGEGKVRWSWQRLFYFTDFTFQISEDQALVYVETIKSYIDEAEKASEQPDNEEEKIREILLERNLEEAAMEQRMEEEEAAKTAFIRSMINADHSGTYTLSRSCSNNFNLSRK